MLKFKNRFNHISFFLMAATLGITSCKVQQANIAYFRNIPDSLYAVAMTKNVTAFKDPVIQSNDLIQVSVLTLDKEDNEVLAAATHIPISAGNSNNTAA